MSEVKDAAKILKAQELARRWEVPTTTVWAMARRGDIPTIRLGRMYRFSSAAIAEFEARGGSVAA